MASPNFVSYDRTLRRIYMLNLVESLSPRPEFRASLVVNPRTGRPLAGTFDGTLPRLAADPEAFSGYQPVNQPRA